MILYGGEGSTLLVKYYCRINRIHAPGEGVPFRIDVRECIVTSAVSRIAIGRLFKESSCRNCQQIYYNQHFEYTYRLAVVP